MQKVALLVVLALMALSSFALANPQQLAATPQIAGEKIYQQYCSVCHTSGIANAPKTGSKKDWSPRFNKIDSLITQAGGKITEQARIEHFLPVVEKGLNAMPPKGTCMTCSNNDLKAAIEYMLPKAENSL